MHEPSRDESLMAEVVKGQRPALEALVRRHATPLLSFLRGMTGDYHRGEELFQEVFLALWTKRRLYEYPRPFKPWLYAIAMNQCRSAWRGARPAVLPIADHAFEPAARDGSPVDTAVAVETASLVAAAVALLPDQQRSVVVLRIWQQLSYAEIAQLLGTAEGSVRSYMHHGLIALRRHLEPQFPGGP